VFSNGRLPANLKFTYNNRDLEIVRNFFSKYNEFYLTKHMYKHFYFENLLYTSLYDNDEIFD
jgi:hypothetical protein